MVVVAAVSVFVVFIAFLLKRSGILLLVGIGIKRNIHKIKTTKSLCSHDIFEIFCQNACSEEKNIAKKLERDIHSLTKK